MIACKRSEDEHLPPDDEVDTDEDPLIDPEDDDQEDEEDN